MAALASSTVIQVGQVLDKYELLDRVGQGGMAIVYRGIDRSLKRVVAVKVLHKHLADYQEARDRFEREAQAVAKLRHENILEIFDYAAKPDSEAYIVTEFIDGQTLKQVITDRPIAFPEIGAMIILQVGRALAHAHAHGILHRDVKPENIMIRSDGVVKLMDFGISHMVDLERLTVTGQLLGSPAYMAPEHVEGRQLDFRTDVFALGIVLYQLCVGRLPFEGKNPHEVLKKIADCKYIDPRTANARIGNRLGRIIMRAMAAQPVDRFQAVGEMVLAIEAYLEESGIPTDKISAELGRYFAAPASYEQALESRLVDHLVRRGRKLLSEDDRPGALDVFDRVLTIDADNADVISILDGINRRLRMRAVGLGLLGALVISGGAYMIHRKAEPPSSDSPPPPDRNSVISRGSSSVVHDDPPPEIDAAVTEPDAQLVSISPNGSGFRPPLLIDASPVTPNEKKELRVTVTPARGAFVDFGEGWVTVPIEDGRVARGIDHDVTVRVKNDCCVPQEGVAKYGQSELTFELTLKPGTIIAHCKLPEASVRIDGHGASLEQKTNVMFEGSFESKSVKLEWTTATKVWTDAVKLAAGQTLEVTCEPPR